MSAALMLEAARLMRETAEFAPDAPWAADVRDDGRAWIEVPDEDGHAWSMHGFPAAARHVAAWHPGVAVTVAAWVESHAKDLERSGGHLPSCDSPGDVEYAQTVALAYLGQVPQ